MDVSSGLAALDWVIIACYAFGVILLGWWVGRKQETTSEYFIGSGRMNPIFIGVSLFATLLSTISYLSIPGEMYAKGPATLAGNLALPFIFLIVGYGLLPIYMKHRVTSAYELLEARLGLGARLMGVFMFLILRLMWMSLLIYLSAKALTTMLGVGEDAIPWIVLITGIVSIVYTSLGGLRAVVITDMLQTILLLGGAWVVIITITFKIGGFSWFPTSWQPEWDAQPIISLDPSTRVTVLGTILSVLFWHVATAGGDQVSIQRFMATRNATDARKSFRTQLLVSIFVTITLTLVGFSLLGYFQVNHDQLPVGIEADHVFPHFIANELPMGISGLVVAALFAAAMSSIDSGVNSITAVVTTDLLDRFGLRPKTERGHVILAKLMAVAIGAVIVIGSSFMKHVPGNITAVTGKTSNLLTTPIFALFVFALFFKRATPLGVFVGAVCGIATAVLTAFSGPIFIENFDATQHRDPVSFQYVGPIALIVNLAVGGIVSLVHRRLGIMAKE